MYDFKLRLNILFIALLLERLKKVLDDSILFYFLQTSQLNANNLSDEITEYYSQDILGSTMLLTDERGNTKEAYSYDAFGNAYEGDFLRVNEIGYNGKRIDSAVNLYNYSFRDMSPMLGRFTTLDRIKDNHNWYVYVNNNPINLIDKRMVYMTLLFLLETSGERMLELRQIQHL